MYKLDKDGEILPVQSYEDDNYFRLNIWGMGEARRLSLWGLGMMKAEQIMEQDSFFGGVFGKETPSPRALAFSQVQEEMSKSLLGHWNIEVDDESWKSDFHSFIEPFGSNGNIATVKQCRKFAEGLDNAFAMIDSSSVIPEGFADTEIFRNFSDWLKSSPHGVYVG